MSSFLKITFPSRKNSKTKLSSCRHKKSSPITTYHQPHSFNTQHPNLNQQPPLTHPPSHHKTCNSPPPSSSPPSSSSSTQTQLATIDSHNASFLAPMFPVRGVRRRLLMLGNKGGGRLLRLNIVVFMIRGGMGMGGGRGEN